MEGVHPDPPPTKNDFHCKYTVKSFIFNLRMLNFYTREAKNSTSYDQIEIKLTYKFTLLRIMNEINKQTMQSKMHLRPVSPSIRADQLGYGIDFHKFNCRSVAFPWDSYLTDLTNENTMHARLVGPYNISILKNFIFARTVFLLIDQLKIKSNQTKVWQNSI